MDTWFESAIADDDCQVEKLLVADPTLINRVHPQHERTALQLAAAWDASRVVAVLLVYVTSLITYPLLDTDGRAHAYSSACVCIWVCSHGADMHASDPEGLTALHLAAAANCVSSLALLLRQQQRLTDKPAATRGKAPPLLVDQRSRDGFTPLLLAAAWGYHECCSLLLKLSSADPLVALDTPPFSTALDLALLGQHHQVVECLRECLE